MEKNKNTKITIQTVPVEIIEDKIIVARGKKVILDRDIAELYKIPTKVLKQSVKRNISRFPEDFMFELNEDELKNWRSQFVTSNSEKMGLRYRPFAFTEQGIAMLSGVLNSEIAVQINIQIMRAFIKMRQILANNQDVIRKIEELDKKYEKYLTKHGSMIIFHEKMISGLSKEMAEISRLLNPAEEAKNVIGFRDRTKTGARG